MATIIAKDNGHVRPSIRPHGQGPTATLTSRGAAYLSWKRTLDFTLALVMLVPGLPLIGLLVLLVRLTSRGPGIYRQVRVGRGGRIFTMYKIRSMSSNAESRSGAIWSTPGDPRVTPLGRLLRKLHLDELPQLFNVLRGQMSLVGPRPERPEFVEILSRKIPGYTDRLAVLPGITGLAQINLPPDTDLDSVRRKQFLDLAYIRQIGPSLDLRLVACTVSRVLRVPEPLAIRFFGVGREVPPWVTDVSAAETSGIRETVAVGAMPSA